MCMFKRVLVLELKKVYVGISIFNQRGKCMVQMEAPKPQGRIQRLYVGLILSKNGEESLCFSSVF